jgi:hypothetical protein
MIDHGVNEYGVPYNVTMPQQSIPLEYQGYIFLAFMAVAIILMLYMFYMIATDPRLEEKR